MIGGAHKLTACNFICIWLGALGSAFLAILYGLLSSGTALRLVGLCSQAAIAASFILLYADKCRGKEFIFASAAILAEGVLCMCYTAMMMQLRYSNLLALSCHIITGLVTLVIVLRKHETGPYMRSFLQCLVFLIFISLLMSLSIVNVLSQSGFICYILLFLDVYKPKTKGMEHGI